MHPDEFEHGAADTSDRGVRRGEIPVCADTLPFAPSYAANLPASITVPAERIVFVEELNAGAEAAAPGAQASRAEICPSGDELAVPNSDAMPAPELPSFDATKSVRLEDENILIDVGRGDGSVTRVHDKRSGLDLILEPRLAGSWKFALPLPGKEPWQTIEANWIVGRQQTLSSIQMDGKKISLKWNGPLTNYLGEKYDASVVETIELAEGGAVFNLAIENRSLCQVGETYFPVFGGIQGLGTNRKELKSTKFVRPTVKQSVESADIFRAFVNMSPFGDQGPEQFYAYPKTLSEPWILLQSGIGRSIFIGATDQSDRMKVARLELVPSGAGTVREDGNWPRPDELKGLPCGVEFSFVDCLGGKIGQDYQAASTFIKFFDGAEHEAKDVYKTQNRGHH